MTTEGEHRPGTIEMPAPTAWPLVLALGITLMLIGLVTNLGLTIGGVLLALIAAAGWARQTFTPEGEEHVALAPEAERPRPVRPSRGVVQHLEPGMPGHRMSVPEKIHPYSAGVKGGLVGGVVMTIPALLYGVLSGHGIWYPINLLSGMVLDLPRLENGKLDVPQLEAFRFGWLLLGTVIHGVTSLGLGLMYGVLLPMLPGRPIFFGGVIAPLLWTGAVYSFMGVLNPALHDAVHWPSFIVSQFIYGLTAGIVVVRSEQVYVGRGEGGRG